MGIASLHPSYGLHLKPSLLVPAAAFSFATSLSQHVFCDDRTQAAIAICRPLYEAVHSCDAKLALVREALIGDSPVSKLCGVYP
jgi:hypothetical protein